MKNFWRAIFRNLHLAAILVVAVVAIVLRDLEVIPEGIVISVILFLLAVHALEDMVSGAEIRRNLGALTRHLETVEPEIEIVKPGDILPHTETLALRNQGEDWWFNICPAMFGSQHLFDKLVKSSLANPKTTRVFFVMEPSMQQAWERNVRPKIERSKGADKVQPVLWHDISENIAFRMVDVGAQQKEALLTLWGEPFMMEQEDSEGKKTHMTRYVIHVKSDSELIVRLSDIFAKHRMGAS